MNKTKTIAFRVTEKQFQTIEKLAGASGKIPSDWCRELCLYEAAAEGGLTRNEKIILEELAKARYLLGIGFGLLSSGKLDADSWNRTKQIVEEKGEDIAAELLKRRK